MAKEKVIATNIEQNGWLGRIVKRDGKNIFLRGRKIREGDNPTPISFSKETSVGDTSSSVLTQPSKTSQFIPDITSSMQKAMSEAARHRQASLIGQGIQGATDGEALAAGTAPAIVDMIRSSVGPRAEAVFTTGVGAITEKARLEQQERKFQMQVRGQNINLLSSLAETGVIADMPNGALQGLASQAGISNDTALAWKARITEADKRSEEDRKLENEKIRAEIAALGRRNRDGGGGGGGGEGVGTMAFLDETIETGIDKGLNRSALIAKATQVAGTVYGQDISEPTVRAAIVSSVDRIREARAAGQKPPPPPEPVDIFAPPLTEADLPGGEAYSRKQELEQQHLEFGSRMGTQARGGLISVVEGIGSLFQ